MISELVARLGPAPAQPELRGEATEQTGEAENSTAKPQGTQGLAEPVGAVLLYPYLDRVGAEAIFATLTGAPARRYDDLAVLSTATLGFALGTGTIEGAKHLRRPEAGPAVGIEALPQLRTLRPRLAALAEGTDPLHLQRGFAAGMLATDPTADPVYFVDAGAGPWCSTPSSRPGSPPPCRRRWPSYASSSARMPRCCWASTAAGTTR